MSAGGGSGIVPAAGQTRWLTVLTAAAMGFLAVFALALSLAADKLAARWDAALAQTATVRISAPPDQIDAQTDTVLAVLGTTTGVAEARLIPDADQAALLAPWLGPDVPLDALPLPRLVEVVETPDGFDRMGLRLRLAAEAPGAVLDDHSRWRAPLVAAAERLRLLGAVSVALIGAALVAMVTLAASASLASNAQPIAVLRLVGARDAFIARAFVRRFTLRALGGAGLGTAAGMAALRALPGTGAVTEVDLLGGLGLQGVEWLYPLAIPPTAALAAWAATRVTAFRVLRKVT